MLGYVNYEYLSAQMSQYPSNYMCTNGSTVPHPYTNVYSGRNYMYKLYTPSTSIIGTDIETFRNRSPRCCSCCCHSNDVTEYCITASPPRVTSSAVPTPVTVTSSSFSIDAILRHDFRCSGRSYHARSIAESSSATDDGDQEVTSSTSPGNHVTCHDETAKTTSSSCTCSDGENRLELEGLSSCRF